MPLQNRVDPFGELCATSARGMPGSGLGLAIVRQVAEAHGGTVTAEHAPGGGTLMRLSVAKAANGSAQT